MTHFDLPATGVNPFELFHEWLLSAKKSEPSDPDAACLSTVSDDGYPSGRMVLVRHVDARGFIFYTNQNSRKGQQMLGQAKASLCYHWKSLQRQIRVEGDVSPISETESDTYHASRPRGSRIGAWVSLQSQPLQSRAVLENRYAEMVAQFEGQDVPRPPHWTGFRIVPKRIEFWQEGQYRLHDRFVFTQRDGTWVTERLYP